MKATYLQRMKTTPLLLVLACSPMMLQGQNLVPNHSFEEIGTCPQGWGMVQSAGPWLNFRATPDLFNSCSSSEFSTPTNYFGTRTPADGEGYVGMYCYYAGLPNRREYLGVALSEPLVPGLPTYVSFQVAAGGGGGATFSMLYLVSHLGATFSMEPWYEEKLTTTARNEADVYTTQVVTYSTMWTTISGVFIPDSAYTHVVLGNFFADDQIQIAPTNWPTGGTPGAYYYLDNVCVSQDPGTACDLPTDVSSVAPTPMFTAWYDSAVEGIRIRSSAPNTDALITLWDGTGRLLLQTRSNGVSETIVPVAGLAPGILLVRSDDGNTRGTVRVHVP